MGNSGSIPEGSENSRQGYISMGSAAQLGTFFSRSSTVNIDADPRPNSFHRSKTWNFPSNRAYEDGCATVCCRSKTRIMESFKSRDEALLKARMYREKNNFEAAQHAYLAALDFPSDTLDDGSPYSCEPSLAEDLKASAPKSGSSLIRKGTIDIESLRSACPSAAICDELAQYYFEKNKGSEALRMYDRALSYSPKNVTFMYRRGVVIQQQGCMQEAADAFRQTLLNNPTYKPALFNLGTVLMRMGENDQAIGCFNSLLAIDPNDDQAQELLAACHESEGRFREAASILQEVVQKDPSNFSTNRDLKRVKSKILN